MLKNTTLVTGRTYDGSYVNINDVDWKLTEFTSFK